MRKELERSDLSAALRAQYLQLLALAYYNKVQKGRAKDVFRQSLKIDPDVPLRGEMSPLMRQQFLLWRKEFLLHHPVRRRPPPPSRSPDLVPSIVLLSIGAAAFVGAAVLGVVALSERDAAEKAYNKLPTAALHFRNADGLALGANLATDASPFLSLFSLYSSFCPFPPLVCRLLPPTALPAEPSMTASIVA